MSRLIKGLVVTMVASLTVLVGMGTAVAHGHHNSANCESGLHTENTNYATHEGPDNFITVWVDDEVVVDHVEFDASYVADIPLLPKTEAHMWKVHVEAWDDQSGSRGFTYTEEGRIDACTTPPPPSQPKPKHAKIHITKQDRCNCWRDRVTVHWDHSKVKVTKDRVSRLRWRITATGRVAANGAAYLLPNRMSGHRGWARTQVYRVHTTNRPCPHHSGPHPNLPPHPSCRGGNCH